MKTKPNQFLTHCLFAGLLALFALLVTGCQKADSARFTPDRNRVASEALSWLVQENQSADGGFGIDFDTGEPLSNISTTLDAILAISAAGYDAAQVFCGQDNSVVDYLKLNAAELTDYAATSVGANGKTVLALVSANQNASEFAGHDYVAQLREQSEPKGGFNGQTAFNQAFALLALAAAGEPASDAQIQWLVELQDDDGSWDDGFGTPRNPDATAMSIMALLANGRVLPDPTIEAGLDFLSDSQLDTGGWEYGAGFGENPNSTALVIQALSATGEDFSDSDGKWTKNDLSPVNALLGWQNSNGAFQADFGEGRFDDVFATLQSIPALAGKWYPLLQNQTESPYEIQCPG